MKKLMRILGIFIWLTGMIIAQNNSTILNGNKLVLSVSSTGKIVSEKGLVAEWPVASGHEYLQSATPLFVIGGQNPQVIEWELDDSMENNPVVLSDHPEDWPNSFQNTWPSYTATGIINADLESYSVSANNSLGLELITRVWQWNHFMAQDMAVVYFELTNNSTNDYDSFNFGLHSKVNAGGDYEGDELKSIQDQVIVSDADGIGKGGGIASEIGEWNKVGQLSFHFIESPELNHDQIDNDNDGMIDESRFDGIDNDNDWSLDTDDLGADGVANTQDEGENDSLATLGEPNFDIMDWDEAEQIPFESFSILSGSSINLNNASELLSYLNSGTIDNFGSGNSFIAGGSNFSLKAGETKRAAIIVMLSQNDRDREANSEIAEQLKNKDYSFIKAAAKPIVSAVSKNKQIILYWDNDTESIPGFEGYKIFKSTDPGFNDSYTVTDDHGILIYHKTSAIFDLNNNNPEFFGEHYNGFRYYLGKNSGLKHVWTDNVVNNGKTYYYAVVAYTRGEENEGIFPTESTKRITVHPDGTVLTEDNTVRVIPNAESMGFVKETTNYQHTNGFATGDMEIEIVDRRLVRNNANYEITFDDTSFSNTVYTIKDITDEQSPIVLISESDNFSTSELKNEGDPFVDGMRFFIFDDPLIWDSSPEKTKWISGNSNWTIELLANSNLGQPVLVPSDYEVRFAGAGVDTAIFTTPIPIPFEVWNVSDSSNIYKENVLVLDQNADGEWNSGEIIYVVEGTTASNFQPVYWSIVLTADTNITSIPPVSGDVAQIKTKKPFSYNDKLIVSTQGLSSNPLAVKSSLNKVAVVPNPYVINSGFEQMSLYTGGSAERKLEFINLPTKCTIRIFDLRGNYLRQLDHKSTVDNGSEFWDLKTKNDETVSYGIYLYHIDAPGIGQTIGRFAIIL